MIERRDETKERGEPVPLALPELCCRVGMAVNIDRCARYPRGNTIRGEVGGIDAPHTLVPVLYSIIFFRETD